MKKSPLLSIQKIALLTVFAVIFNCSLAANATAQNVQSAEVPEFTIEQLLDSEDLFPFTLSFSPDGEHILISSDATGIYNIYAMPVGGGEPIPLTHSTKKSIQFASYFPDDERIIYRADQGGNELSHVYVKTPDGKVIDLTPGKGFKATFGGFSDDGESFFIHSTKRDGRYFDLYKVDINDYEKVLIYKNTSGLDIAGVSPNERYIAFTKPNIRTDSDIYIYDRETEEMRHMTPHKGEVVHRFVDFTPDGSAFYFVTDKNSEFNYIAKMDIATGKATEVLRPEWGVMNAEVHANGKYLTVLIIEDARIKNHIYSLPEMNEIMLPDFAGKSILAVDITEDGSQMAFFASSSHLPRNLFIHQLGSKSEPKQLTHTLSDNIKAQHLVPAQNISFNSYDGVEIPGLLFKPHQASVQNPVPAVIWVHGGPGGLSADLYTPISPLFQYLINHGYAVYAINNRGSRGYGKTFEGMDDQKHGMADLDDVVASKKMLINTGWIDSTRIGIIGASYGGYMTLAALTFRPTAFDVGVDIFGISNWIRTLENIPPWWTSARKSLYDEMGHPKKDREMLYSISPLFHADNIVRPLMVLQGANDPRVLKVESDEIVEAVRANGVPVEYIVFEDEGHGFRKHENRKEAYQSILAFLDRYLKKQEPIATDKE